MMGEEQLALYGLGILLILLLLRMMYRLVTGPVGVVGGILVLSAVYSLGISSIVGSGTPEVVDKLLLGLPFEVVSQTEATEITIGWEYVEAWQAFGLHIVLGFLGVVLVYSLMEWWYTGAALSGVAWIWSVIQLDQYLLESVLHWHPWMPFYEAVIFAGAAGFGVGVILAIMLMEPEFNSTVPGSRIEGGSETDEDVFDRLNL